MGYLESTVLQCREQPSTRDQNYVGTSLDFTLGSDEGPFDSRKCSDER